MSAPLPIKARRRRASSSFVVGMSPLNLSASCSPVVGNHRSIDVEVFNFKPQHLAKWKMEDKLWETLPEELKDPIKNLQHAGASVLSSLDRLEDRVKTLPPVDDEDDSVTFSSISNAGTASELIAFKLEEHLKLMNNKPNRPKPSDNNIYNCKPIPDDKRYINSVPSSRTRSAGNQSFGSFSGTNSTGFISPTALLSPPSMMSPVSPNEGILQYMSPFTLGGSGVPATSRNDNNDVVGRTDVTNNPDVIRRDSVLSGMTTSSGSHRSGGRRFKAPKHWKSAMYHAELEELRQREMVCLRHSQHPINIAWCEMKRQRPMRDNTEFIEQFNEWFTETKRKVASLDEHVRGLCAGIHFSLGWSDTPGLDFEHKDPLCP
jgi:hypothetical protein